MIQLSSLLHPGTNQQSATHHNLPQTNQLFLLSNQEKIQQPEPSDQGMILQTVFCQKA